MMEAPNIAQYFPHLQDRVMPQFSMGQKVLSDWADKPDNDPVFALYKCCGFINRDEAAILYNAAKTLGGREWLDIGAHTGWTALHAAAAGYWVTALDPMYANDEFRLRAESNAARAGFDTRFCSVAATSRMWFGGDRRYERALVAPDQRYDGVMIDGDHCWMEPLYDAVWSLKHLNNPGVILLHDFIGGPVREAVRYLMVEGMKCRVYISSSQCMALCWRGEFTPPDCPTRFSDSEVAGLKNLMQDFYFQVCV